MNRTITLLLAALLTCFAGCASHEPLAFIRGSDITAADQAPVEKVYTKRAPGAGNGELIQRGIKGQPPLIPHSIARVAPITVADNACLDCHISGDEVRGKPIPKIGVSHFSKSATGPNGSPAVSMARWQCDSCHVPQAEALPLVENTFATDVR